jgi:hypothetical protein
VPLHEVWCVYGKGAVTATFTPGALFKATNEHVVLALDKARSLSTLCPATFTLRFSATFLDTGVATEVTP